MTSGVGRPPRALGKYRPLQFSLTGPTSRAVMLYADAARHVLGLTRDEFVRHLLRKCRKTLERACAAKGLTIPTAAEADRVKRKGKPRPLVVRMGARPVVTTLGG